MKKILFSLLGFLMAGSMAFAGGLVTNTNQSATWARMLVRDASTSIDAVYYNPAGLTKLSDGLHLSVSNQSIFQKRSITNSLFPDKEYEGKVSAPFFPNLYAAYKTGKFAFSLGFTPIGGGGSASYDTGIPMIEMLIASLPDNFTALGANGGYTYNASFEGSSVYFGIQGGISYAINDMISVYAGARYVMASNSYTGAINNIVLSSDNPNMPQLTNATLTGAGDSYQAGGDGMQPLVDGGAGSLTFAQAEGATLIDAATRAQLEGGLLALGYPQAAIDAMNITTAQGTYYGAATNFYTGAAALADKELDVKQKGSGFTPILGANIALMEDKLNIGIKYEFQTNMDVENETAKDVIVGGTPTSPVTMYPDGEKYNADIPAQLSIGVNYMFSDKFSAQVGYHTYFDKKAGWSTIEGSNPEISVIDKNYMEIGVGFEFNVSEQLLLSAGYLRAQTGANDYYHDDLSYSLSSNTFGLGGAYKINDMLTLQLGGYYTAYPEETIPMPAYANLISQTYNKSNMAFAIGLDFTFGGK
ncbi:MAG: hypothetical protein P1P88_15120 [Bacteroidales bacterium]|nr:hypothetical protein [Bacteroidales bacterium]